MKDHSQIIELIGRIIHKYNQWDNKKRTYGTDIPLTKAEIHTIAAVGDHPGINITTLAQVLGVTKGAASQMILPAGGQGHCGKKRFPRIQTPRWSSP